MLKKSLLLLALVALFQFSAEAKSDELNLKRVVSGQGTHFRISGEQSLKMADAFFIHFADSKRKGYIWNFKKVQIPGMEKKVNFQVMQGISGQNSSSSSCCATSYFHAYTSERYKKQLDETRTEYEQDALMIYIRDGRNSVLNTDDKVALAMDFLKSIYNKSV
ncbi:MAG: hypothetical protein MI810_09145 [Flavobacteriales bacterium]|nr:hypothetical protein [Flavobacteriales bacterium]